MPRRRKELRDVGGQGGSHGEIRKRGLKLPAAFYNFGSEQTEGSEAVLVIKGCSLRFIPGVEELRALRLRPCTAPDLSARGNFKRPRIRLGN